MIRPDAIPVAPQQAALSVVPGDVDALFGRGYALRGTERVALVRLGREAARATVVAGAPALSLDAATADRLGGIDGVRLVGSCGALAAPTITRIAPRLVLPAGLRRAWNVGDVATLALGSVAVAATVVDGLDGVATLDHGMWLAAGCPDTARWLPGVSWAVPAPETSPESDAITGVERRVVTETDVRQARLRGQRIRLAPGQIVTPAARSLAREWDVFAPAAGDATAPQARRRA